MLVAGIMSGTSVDAIDVALVEIRGRGWDVRLKQIGFHSTAHRPEVRRRILAVASGGPTSAQEISQLNFLIGELFARAFHAACRRTGIPTRSVKLIGSHGQTIHHQPVAQLECGVAVRSTLQIGEPAIIAARTGIPVIADFRPADIAAGGQGAPLVPYFDYAMYRSNTHGRVVLNIGGIGNMTILPKDAKPTDVRAFDSGPGNMLIDHLTRIATRGKQDFDRGGRLAAKGKVDEEQIRRMLQDKYFRHRPPKSTGREMYGVEFARRWFPIEASSPNATQWNAIATATAFTAASIVDAIKRFALPLRNIRECLVSGGGIYNSFLMRQLRRRLESLPDTHPPMRVISLADAAIPARSKEAAAFALLAYQTLHGNPSNVLSATGAKRPALLGKLSPTLGR